ncbi:MAG: hypothetical protein IJW44_03735 [Clostridia bacterium]|nr:hypothetical protein [Clostridia bacterium]
MRIILKRIGVLLAALLLSLAVVSCAKKEKSPTDTDNETLAAYTPEQIGLVRLDAYTGLTVELENTDSSKGEAVWEAVLARAEVVTYPEEQVAYYRKQSQAKYRYLAERADVSYEEMLSALGVTEESLLEEARQMVKGDLVYRYIVQDTGIALTDAEKAELFDRYAEKYVSEYGYTKEYVTEHLSEHVYDSMLYDKTMQYLIDRNTFAVSQAQ